MIERSITDRCFAAGDSQLTVLVTGARLNAAIVPIGEELTTKAIKPFAALIGALTRLHLGSST